MLVSSSCYSLTPKAHRTPSYLLGIGVLVSAIAAVIIISAHPTSLQGLGTLLTTNKAVIVLYSIGGATLLASYVSRRILKKKGTVDEVLPDNRIVVLNSGNTDANPLLQDFPIQQHQIMGPRKALPPVKPWRDPLLLLAQENDRLVLYQGKTEDKRPDTKVPSFTLPRSLFQSTPMVITIPAHILRQEEENLVVYRAPSKPKRAPAPYISPISILKPLLIELVKNDQLLNSFWGRVDQKKLAALNVLLEQLTKLDEQNELENALSPKLLNRICLLFGELSHEVYQVESAVDANPIISLSRLSGFFSDLHHYVGAILEGRPPRTSLQNLIKRGHGIISKISSPQLRRALLILFVNNFRILKEWSDAFEAEGFSLKANRKETADIIKLFDYFCKNWILENPSHFVKDSWLVKSAIRFGLPHFFFMPTKDMSLILKLFDHLYDPMINAFNKEIRHVYKALFLLAIDGLSQAISQGIESRDALNKVSAHLMVKVDTILQRILKSKNKDEILSSLKKLFEGVENYHDTFSHVRLKQPLSNGFWQSIKIYNDFPEMVYIRNMAYVAHMEEVRSVYVLDPATRFRCLRGVLDPIAHGLIEVDQGWRRRNADPKKIAIYNEAIGSLVTLSSVVLDDACARIKSLSALLFSFFKLAAPDEVAAEMAQFISNNLKVLEVIQGELLTQVSTMRLSHHFAQKELQGSLNALSTVLTIYGRRFTLRELNGYASYYTMLRGSLYVGNLIGLNEKYTGPLKALMGLFSDPVKTLLDSKFRYLFQGVLAETMMELADELPKIGVPGLGLDDFPSIFASLQRILAKAAETLKKIALYSENEQLAQKMEVIYKALREYHSSLLEVGSHQRKVPKRPDPQIFNVAIPSTLPEMGKILENAKTYHKELSVVDVLIPDLQQMRTLISSAIEGFSKQTKEGLQKLKMEVQGREERFRNLFPKAHLHPDLAPFAYQYTACLREVEILRKLSLYKELKQKNLPFHDLHAGLISDFKEKAYKINLEKLEKLFNLI